MTKQNNYAGFICDGVQCRSVSSILPLMTSDTSLISLVPCVMPRVLVLALSSLRAWASGHSAVRSVLKGGAPELPDKFYPYFSHI